MLTLRTIVAIALSSACRAPWSAGFANKDQIVRELNRLICKGILRRVEPLPRGEVAAVLYELEREHLVETLDIAGVTNYKPVICDVLECEEPATQWSELDPEECVCHICAEIEGDQL